MRLAEVRSAEVADARDTPLVALLPLGAVEQHSRHLPLGTDTLIVEAVATAVERRLPGSVVLLPTVCVGASDHHLAMAGSASIGTLAVADAAARQCLSLAQSSGITRFLLLNGHGGNQPAVRLALETVHAANPGIRALAADYWSPMFEVLDAAGHARPDAMGHADHIETSILLAVRPELVRMDLAADDGYADGLGPSVATTSGIPERTAHGGVGDPRRATAAEGEAYLNAATDGAARLIDHLLR